MFYSTLFAAATAFTGMVSAQYYSTSGPLMIDPNQVDAQLRQSWCIGQQNSCPMLCGGSTAAGGNMCNPTTLNYTCMCPSGMTTPNVSDYAATMPSYICAQWVADCTTAHPNDAIGQAGCQSVICGSKNASSAELAASSGSSSSASASASSKASSATAASGASSTGMTTTTASSGSAASSTSASAAAASSTHASSAAAVMNVAKQYGTGILATGLLAIFGLVL